MLMSTMLGDFQKSFGFMDKLNKRPYDIHSKKCVRACVCGSCTLCTFVIFLVV